MVLGDITSGAMTFGQFCQLLTLQLRGLLTIIFNSSENLKVVEESKPKAEDDLNVEESSSEDDDELTQAGHELKDMLDREEGRESFDEEDEDPDKDEVKGTSALFLQGETIYSFTDLRFFYLTFQNSLTMQFG